MIERINQQVVSLYDIISIKNDLIDEIVVFYALEQQFKVISLNSAYYFCDKCKQAEYDFHLSIISQISVSDDIKLALIIQKQEVENCSDYTYLKERLNYFYRLNSLKKSTIASIISEYENTPKSCHCCNSKITKPCIHSPELCL